MLVALLLNLNKWAISRLVFVQVLKTPHKALLTITRTGLSVWEGARQGAPFLCLGLAPRRGYNQMSRKPLKRCSRVGEAGQIIAIE
jgi:hypothetical protein